MTWGWTARGPLPVDSTAVGTTGGGNVGSATEAGKTQAWPRYEAEYLKRALTSERYKYDTEGLDPEQKAIYLDKDTAGYKDEADECLKAEFDQWLQGLHSANDPQQTQCYENAEGKPVRRWTQRTPESTDENGNSKVGLPRAGWKHTPWGRSSLTHLPGVREYLREQEERANDADLRMQILADYGPQNIDDAWKYFKHWVKGRPLSDAVALPARFKEAAPGTRSDFGMQQPDRMLAYDAEMPDRQPQVYATDHNARQAAIAQPGQEWVTVTTDAENDYVREARQFREHLQSVVGTADMSTVHEGEEQAVKRDERAEAKDVASAHEQHKERRQEAKEQTGRLQELTAPKGLAAF